MLKGRAREMVWAARPLWFKRSPREGARSAPSPPRGHRSHRARRAARMKVQSIREGITFKQCAEAFIKTIGGLTLRRPAARQPGHAQPNRPATCSPRNQRPADSDHSARLAGPGHRRCDLVLAPYKDETPRHAEAETRSCTGRQANQLTVDLPGAIHRDLAASGTAWQETAQAAIELRSSSCTISRDRMKAKRLYKVPLADRRSKSSSLRACWRFRIFFPGRSAKNLFPTWFF